MRIGIDARSLLETQPSGVSVYTNELTRALSSALGPDDELRLFFCGRRSRQAQPRALSHLPNTTVWHLPWPNKVFHAAALVGVAPLIDQVLHGVDVLLVPNWHMLPVGPKVPVVLTVHDLSFRLYPHFLSWRRRGWHAAVQPVRLLQRAQRVIAVSAATAGVLHTEYDIAAERLTVIPSGQPTLAAAEAVPDLPAHYILAIGTLEPRKNLHTLVQAFMQYRRQQPHSQLQLVMVGATGWKSRDLRRLMSHEPAIHYYGYISSGKKRSLLEQAAALFYPSIYEGFGFPPLEALALGTPVVVGRAGALPEILQPAVWYVNPYAQSEVEAYFKLFDHSPRRHPANSNTAWQQWQWSQTAAATLQVLHQTV